MRLAPVSTDSSFDRFFRCNAYRLHGFISSQSGDMDRASEYWREGLKHGASRSVLENLAIYHQERGEFDAGDAYFRQAIDALKESRSVDVCGAVSTLEEEATFT